MGVLPGIKAFVAAVLGGIGNIPGAALGGLAHRRRRDVRGRLVVFDLPRCHRVCHLDPDPAFQARRPARQIAGRKSLTPTRRERILHSKKVWLLAAVVVSAVCLAVFRRASTITICRSSSSIGINIILAVSLNLINGYTGQFSLGHAGFMAVGAYAVRVSVTTETRRGDCCTRSAGRTRFRWRCCSSSRCCSAALAAAVAGLIVGVPSLRLKGDYLAIVTLGFGEIIRVIIQNTDAVGGGARLQRHPGLHDAFLGVRARGAHDLRRGQPDRFDLRPRLPRRARRRDRRRGDGHQHDAVQGRRVRARRVLRRHRGRALRAHVRPTSTRAGSISSDPSRSSSW